MTKDNTTSNAHIDLPTGRPPLADVSYLTEPDHSHQPEDSMRAASQAHTQASDDTLSTFSCAGDLLPDETTDVNLIEAAGTDNEFVAIRRIANVLARRRQLDPEIVMPKLQVLFDAQLSERERSSSLPTGLGKSTETMWSLQSGFNRCRRAISS